MPGLEEYSQSLQGIGRLGSSALSQSSGINSGMQAIRRRRAQQASSVDSGAAFANLSQYQDTGVGANIVNIAKQLQGVPYKWGGTTLRGIDCSGLIQYVYGKVGKKIPRTSQQQIGYGQAIDPRSAQPGDPLFFSNKTAADHVSMYIGNGQMLHAPRTGDVVRIVPVNWGKVIGARRY